MYIYFSSISIASSAAKVVSFLSSALPIQSSSYLILILILICNSIMMAIPFKTSE